MRPFIFSTDITSATTVSGIQAKIQQYQPDVVFVDGAYLMQSELPKSRAGITTGDDQHQSWYQASGPGAEDPYRCNNTSVAPPISQWSHTVVSDVHPGMGSGL